MVSQKQKSISIIEVRIRVSWVRNLLILDIFADYLLAEAERKKREKQEAIEREKAEDLKAEQKFIRQQEQLRQEAEQEKIRKIEEDRVRRSNQIAKPTHVLLGESGTARRTVQS